MLDNIKNLMNLKSIDKNIADNNFELALNKLNELVRVDYNPSETYLKRGLLCKKLLMLDNAYSDFTYIINHCAEKKEAYYERVILNIEIANYYEAILDADTILSWDTNNFEIKRIKFLALMYSSQDTAAKEYLFEIFENNKYRIIQFLFNEVAILLAKDEFAKGLKILDLIEDIDRENPIMYLKKANIYALAGDKEKETEFMKKIENSFPRYFVSKFKYYDMYKEMDLLEISFLLELKLFDTNKIFSYPMKILEGYKNYLEGHIIDAKECFEEATSINPYKAEAYVLLGETLQLMSGYDNPDYKTEAEKNYQIAAEIYEKENNQEKLDYMEKQIKHLNSSLSILY